eukprot:Gb_07702 [translate_table: standard]
MSRTQDRFRVAERIFVQPTSPVRHHHGSRRALLEPVPVSPSFGLTNPDEQHKSHGPYMSETNFDTNMVIILAALLCALICALGLNSIVRCALRCSRRMVFESAEDVAVRLANTGIKRKALRALPTMVYGNGSQLPDVGTDCPICLAEFVEGEKVRVLPKCNHGFHVKCIDTWLLSHSSCPTCRHSLLEFSENNSTSVQHEELQVQTQNQTNQALSAPTQSVAESSHESSSSITATNHVSDMASTDPDSASKSDDIEAAITGNGETSKPQSATSN